MLRIHLLLILYIFLSVLSGGIMPSCSRLPSPSPPRELKVPLGSEHRAATSSQPPVDPFKDLVPPQSPTPGPAAPTGEQITKIEPFSPDAVAGPGKKGQKTDFSETKEITVAVDAMPLPDFLHRVFGDILKVNYVIDPKVPDKEKLSLNISNKITEQQLFDMVSDILSGFKVIIQKKDDVFYLVPGTKEQETLIGIGVSIKDVPQTMGQVRQYIPLRHVNASTLMQVVPGIPGVQVFVYPGENMMIATGPRDGVIQVVSIAGALDQPAMRGRFAAMLRVRYWDPEDLTEKIKQLLSQEGIPVAVSPGQQGVLLLPLGRWRTVITFAAEKFWIERVKYWILTLDVPEEREEKKFFIFFPKNSKAQELTETVSKILGISMVSGGPSKKTGDKIGDKTGVGGELPGSGEKKDFLSGGTMSSQLGLKSPGATGTKEGTPGKASSTSEREDIELPEIGKGVRIAADDNRNAIVIYATAAKYKALESLLQQLDVMPAQVLIEAMVAEVTLTGNLQFGLEWYFKNISKDATQVLKTLGGLGLGTGGLDYALVGDSKNIQVVFNALAQENLIKVLSSPRVTVRDGKTATLHAGTQVPVITGETTSPGVQVAGNTGLVRAVQYRTTGISLNVSPVIHSRGVVALQITQEVSEPQTNKTSNIDSPVILSRNISTEVVAADNQTILLGGLIKENKSQGVQKVPFLGDIPVLGYLFKTTSIGSDRTELVVMLTPRIIRNPQQIDDMREAIFKSFENIRPEK